MGSSPSKALCRARMVKIAHNGNASKPYKLNIMYLSDKYTYNGDPQVTLDSNGEYSFVYHTKELKYQYDTLYERNDEITKLHSGECGICGNINNCKEDI